MQKTNEGNPNTQLRYERTRRGWSQEDVAEKVGTSSVNVSRWERGVTFPIPFFRQKLSELFEKNPQELGLLQNQKDESTEQPPGETAQETEAEPLEKDFVSPSLYTTHSASDDLDDADTFDTVDSQSLPDELSKLRYHSGKRKHGISRPLMAIGSLLVIAGIVLASLISFQHAPSKPTSPAIYTFSNPGTEVSSVAWSPNGKQVAVGNTSNKIQVWDATTGQPVHTYLTFESQVTDVAWSPDGKYIAETGASGAIQVLDVATGVAIHNFTGPTGTELSIAWSPDSMSIATASMDGIIRVWNLATGTLAYAFDTHSAYYAYTVAWSPNAQYIAAGNEGTLQVWNASTEQPVFSYKNLGNQSVIGIAWSPDSQYIAFGAGDTSVQVWNVLSDKQVYSFQELGNDARSVAWSPDGKRLAAAGSILTGAKNNLIIQVWDALTGQHVYTYTGHSKEVTSVAWSPDSRHLASGDLGGTVEIWSDM
jgi:WD40 repeat protein